MNPRLLLDALRETGAVFRVEGRRLTVNAPPGILTTAINSALREQKPLVIALLAAGEPAVDARVAAMRGRHPDGAPYPFLTVRDVPRGSGGCLSCGDPIAPHEDGLAVRCRECALAAQLVIHTDCYGAHAARPPPSLATLSPPDEARRATCLHARACRQTLGSPKAIDHNTNFLVGTPENPC